MELALVEGPKPLREKADSPKAHVLVAGIGNVFLGDDGFGVHVALELRARVLPPGVDVVDFGIRRFDLAFALGHYDAAILVDVLPRGGTSGTLYFLTPRLDEEPTALDPRATDPLVVLRFARSLRPLPRRTVVVGCEPELQPVDDYPTEMTLSPHVAAAVPRAVRAIEELLPGLLAAARERCELDETQGG